MSFWNRSKETVVAVAKEIRRGFFSSGEVDGRLNPRRHRDNASALLAAYRQQAPLVVSRMAAGQDALDNSVGCNSIKGAYAFRDPHMSDAILGFFLNTGFIGHQVAALLAQHWLIAKACSVPARDAIRQGFEIVTDTGKQEMDNAIIKEMRKADKRFKLNKNLVQYLTLGRVYGIRIAFLKVRSTDPKYYENPFNPDGVTPNSYEGIVQVDPYWLAPVLDAKDAADPASATFYEPTWWMINGKKYHRSHLLIYRHGPPLPDVLKPTYLYGGIPLPQLILERVYNAERTANEAPQLAMTKRTTVFGTDVAEAIENKELFDERLALFANYRDNYAVKVMDKEADEMQQFDTSLSDLDTVIMTGYQLVAAAAEMPATKLLGTTPKGFNATGQYDESSYHEMLESVQEHDLTDFVERHHLCVMRSIVAPKLSIAPVETSIMWEPLDSPTAKELAETNKAEADTDKALVEAGAIDGQDVRDRLRKDKNSGYYQIDPVAPEEPLVPPMTVAQPGAPVPIAETSDAADSVKLVSNQRYIDPAIVAEKLAARDFTVHVSPTFVDPQGQRYRIVIDGHHSLAAARQVNVPPTLVEGDYSGSDYEVLCDA